MNTPTQDEKLTVLKGIFASWLVSILFISISYRAISHLEFFSELTAQKSCALALLLAALSLALGIGWAARTRHLSSHIDGTAPKSGEPLDITLRYITNTSEQLLLFAAVCLALTFIAPDFARRLLPVMGVWFLIARLIFWAGYKNHPLKRAIGFAATFHPTLVLMAFAAFKLTSG